MAVGVFLLVAAAAAVHRLFATSVVAEPAAGDAVDPATVHRLFATSVVAEPAPRRRTVAWYVGQSWKRQTILFDGLNTCMIQAGQEMEAALFYSSTTLPAGVDNLETDSPGPLAYDNQCWNVIHSYQNTVALTDGRGDWDSGRGWIWLVPMNMVMTSPEYVQKGWVMHPASGRRVEMLQGDAGWAVMQPVQAGDSSSSEAR